MSSPISVRANAPVIDLEISTKAREKLRNLDIMAEGLSVDSISNEGCQFLVDSGIAFWMNCFHNSQGTDSRMHVLKMLLPGCLSILQNGEYVSLEKVLSSLRYDVGIDKVVDKSGQVWSYRSPEGLVPRDRFSYEELEPIEQLSGEAYSAVLVKARNFWEGHREIDSGKSKECILQIVTTQHYASEDPLVRNVMDSYPQHTTFRLIDKRGKVYSFGMQMEKDQQSTIFDEGMLQNLLKTTVTKISTPDYEEAKPCHSKMVTHIAITEERFKKIADFITVTNKSDLSFNFMFQNCSTLAREVLRCAGFEDFPRRITAYQYLSGLFPGMDAIPGIGKTLHMCIDRIKEFVVPIFNFLNAYTPPTITRFVRQITDVVTYIPRLITTIFISVLMASMGAFKMSKPLPPGREDNRDNSTRLTSFSSLFQAPMDLFDERLQVVDSHLSLRQWQLQQRSTENLMYDGKVKLYM